MIVIVLVLYEVRLQPNTKQNVCPLQISMLELSGMKFFKIKSLSRIRFNSQRRRLYLL